MSYRSIQLIVPIQYYHGLHKTQTDSTAAEMQLFDGDPRTYGQVGSAGDADMICVDTATPKWCFVDGDEAIRTSGTGTMNIEGNGNTIALTSYHAEVGKSSAWTVSTPNFYRNNTNTEQFQSLLLKLNNSTAYAKWGFDNIGVFTTTYKQRKRGFWFSKDFAVPLFDRKHSQSESFKTAAERTRTGNIYDDWRAARYNQAISIHTFKWSDLTVAQYGVFEDFMDAFGGNIQQPFVMCRITNEGTPDNYEMQYWRLIIQSESIEITKTKGSPARYSLTFTAQEQLIDY